MGVDLHGKTVGVIGTGKIGLIFAQIMRGFGCVVVGYDPFPTPAFEGWALELDHDDHNST